MVSVPHWKACGSTSGIAMHSVGIQISAGKERQDSSSYVVTKSPAATDEYSSQPSIPVGMKAEPYTSTSKSEPIRCYREPTISHRNFTLVIHLDQVQGLAPYATKGARRIRNSPGTRHPS